MGYALNDTVRVREPEEIKEDEYLDTSRIGKVGKIVCLDGFYAGVGETPGDPLISVRFRDSVVGTFWSQELELIHPTTSRKLKVKQRRKHGKATMRG